jgi:RNA polymerase sigma-70 factor (ECF subfamily)
MYVCQNEELAKDAVQVGFTSAYRYLHTYSERATFKTWLLKIVHNEALRILKIELRYTVDLQDVNAEIEQLDHSTTLHLEQQATSEWVLETMNKMKNMEALVLKMHYLQELKLSEIAEIISMKEGNVKVILHRARHSFKTIMEKHHGTS